MGQKILVGSIIEQNLDALRGVVAKVEGDDRTAVVVALNYIQELERNIRQVQPSLVSLAKCQAINIVGGQLGLPPVQFSGEDSFLELPEQPIPAKSTGETEAKQASEIIEPTQEQVNGSDTRVEDESQAQQISE